MSTIEFEILSLGSTWQMARLLPFLLILCFSLVTTIVFRSRIKKIKYYWLCNAMILILPAVTYFGFSPIFQSDLYDLSREIEIKEYSIESKKSLTIYALPNCPYCVESIEIINHFHRRNPKIGIEYVIVSNAEGGEIAKQLPGFVKLSYDNGSKDIERITQGSYPTFVFYDGSKDLKLWDNNSFGTKALDLIENK